MSQSDTANATTLVDVRIVRFGRRLVAATLRGGINGETAYVLAGSIMNPFIERGLCHMGDRGLCHMGDE